MQVQSDLTASRPLPVAPAARTIRETEAHYGWSRSYIYLNLAAGLLEAKKAGRRTLIVSESADRLFASLPRQTFRAKVG